MTDPTGAFYSTQDADSEGEEGKFYVWTPKELESALGARDAAILAALWGVTDAGNFEGKNILHVARDAANVAATGWRVPTNTSRRSSPADARGCTPSARSASGRDATTRR